MKKYYYEHDGKYLDWEDFEKVLKAQLELINAGSPINISIRGLVVEEFDEKVNE